MIETVLKEVIDGEVAGDPMQGHKWVRRSLNYLAHALAERHYPIAPATVRRLLRKLAAIRNVKFAGRGEKRIP